VLNDKNPWWIVMPDVARYLQRVSFLLRQGRPANDIALYLPADDAWAHLVPGKIGTMMDALSQWVGPDIVAAILDAGFNVDFVDDGVLSERARMDGGALTIGPSRYRALVLPGVEQIPATTMSALERFARQGLIVAATRRTPALAPGYLATPGDHAAIRATAERLFRGPAAPGLFVEREGDLAAALTTRLAPDMAVSAGAQDIGFVHRRTDAGDVYFVANTANVRRAFDATFRVAAPRAEQWNPVTGDTTPVASRRSPKGDRTVVSLDLDPYESTVVVFPTGVAPAMPRSTVRTDRLPEAIDISTGWRVAFGAGGTPREWATLQSWTDDEATRFFSGVATYEKTVTVPASFLRGSHSVSLDLGAPKAIEVGGPRARVQAWIDSPVRDAAVVTVNGRRVGSAWCPPYRLDVTSALRPGPNTIRIDVANLAINDMAGHARPDYKLLNLRYGTRFEPQDMDKVQPVPAGLLGPIRLVAARLTSPTR
jgi:hypothetical protein